LRVVSQIDIDWTGRLPSTDAKDKGKNWLKIEIADFLNDLNGQFRRLFRKPSSFHVTLSV
jgi:hypothetical protein